jgi:hypothetical protein
LLLLLLLLPLLLLLLLLVLLLLLMVRAEERPNNGSREPKRCQLSRLAPHVEKNWHHFHRGPVGASVAGSRLLPAALVWWVVRVILYGPWNTSMSSAV